MGEILHGVLFFYIFYKKKTKKAASKLLGSLCYFESLNVYLATLSSHFNITNITHMDIKHAVTKSVHVAQIGICS